MTGVSRPAWHDCLKHLLTASEMSRDWGHWRSVGKWGLVVRGLDALLYPVRRSCRAAARSWKRETESAGFPLMQERSGRG